MLRVTIIFIGLCLHSLFFFFLFGSKMTRVTSFNNVMDSWLSLFHKLSGPFGYLCYNKHLYLSSVWLGVGLKINMQIHMLKIDWEILKICLAVDLSSIINII